MDSVRRSAVVLVGAVEAEEGVLHSRVNQKTPMRPTNLRRLVVIPCEEDQLLLIGFEGLEKEVALVWISHLQQLRHLRGNEQEATRVCCVELGLEVLQVEGDYLIVQPVRTGQKLN